MKVEKINLFKNYSSGLKTIISIGLTFFVLAIIFRYWNHSYKNIIASDGKGYYAYLPAIFIYQDLNFEFFFNGLLQIDKEYTSSFLYDIKGENVIKYPVGVAFLQLPFFAIACLVTFLTGGLMDGYSFWFQILISISAIFYTLLGLYNIHRLLQTYNFDGKIICWLLVALALGTNLTFYTVYDASMSHAYSFCLVSILFYNARLFMLNSKKSALLWCAFAIGSIVLVRSINVIILLAIPVFADSTKQLFLSFKKLFNYPFTLFMVILIIVAILAIQPLVWYLQTENFYVWTYLNEWFDFSNPKIFKALFSFRKGWFIYTPFMILIIPGLIYFLLKKQYREFFFSFTVLSAAIYLIASWWCWYFGGSFGTRSLIEFYPLAIIPIAHFMSSGMLIRRFLIPFIVISIFLNLIQSFQYKNNILHYDAMTSEKYWKIFLKTSSKYKWLIFKNPNSISDKDIESRIIYKSFYEVDYPVNNWIPFYNIDISDEALSGNKVLDFSQIENDQKFEILNDSFALNTDLAIRFTGWFKGNPENLHGYLCIMSHNDTIDKREIRSLLKNHGLEKNGWKKYDFDILQIQKPFNKIEIKFTKTIESILMDDAMFYVYKN